jgi:hypothetical protein
MKSISYTKEELEIMRTALPIVEAAGNSDQDFCWPGDGPAHDDHCLLSDHSLAAAAVEATEGLTWDFSSWTRTADWFRSALRELKEYIIETTYHPTEFTCQWISDAIGDNPPRSREACEADVVAFRNGECGPEFVASFAVELEDVEWRIREVK